MRQRKKGEEEEEVGYCWVVEECADGTCGVGWLRVLVPVVELGIWDLGLELLFHVPCALYLGMCLCMYALLCFAMLCYALLSYST